MEKYNDKIPKGWHTYTLGEIYTERKEAGDPELPILTVSIHSGVSDGALDDEEIGKTVKRIADKTKYKTVRAGDLVFNMMRAWQGAIGVARSDGLVSPAYIVATPNEELVYPLFMDYYMKSPKMVGIIKRQSYGVTDFRKRLYWDSFAPIRCTLPSIAEQKKISQILAAQEKLVKKQEILLGCKTENRKYLLQSLFSNSDCWEELRMTDCVNRITKKNSCGNSNILTISAQYGLINQSDFFDKEIASEDKSDYYFLERDDFAYNKSYSNGYPFGAIKRLTRYDAGIVSPLYICFRVNSEQVSIDFLEQYFEAGLLNREIHAYAQEGARNHGLLNIAVEDFFNSKVYLPPMEEQLKIAKILKTADREIELLQASIEQEKQKKKSLMQLLLTGIVRV